MADQDRITQVANLFLAEQNLPQDTELATALRSLLFTERLDAYEVGKLNGRGELIDEMLHDLKDPDIPLQNRDQIEGYVAGLAKDATERGFNGWRQD